ncbi:MAG: 5'-methylthioadenosine/S-adenosylhomocysteine nucleosidase family protein [Halobacteriota archaeon]
MRGPEAKRRATAPTQEFFSSDGTPASVTRSPQVESKAVILTATQVEYEAVCKHLDIISGEVCLDEQFYDVGEFATNGRRWYISTAKIPSRSSMAASEVGAAIQCFEPEIILFVGTAAGVKKKDLKIGYVVAATKAYDVDSGRETDSGFIPEPREAKSDSRAIGVANRCIREKIWKTRIEEETQNSELEAHAGPVATTSKLVKSLNSPTCKIIKIHYGDVLALEQEGFGFLQAAKRNNTCAIVIRGVADFVKDKDVVESEGSKERAMRNATAFAFELIANLKD